MFQFQNDSLFILKLIHCLSDVSKILNIENTGNYF